MGQSQAGVGGLDIDNAGHLPDFILQDDNLGATIDGLVYKEVPVSLMTFKGDKGITRCHPAGVISQTRDGNIFISPNIQDLETLEKLGQTFLTLLVVSRQGGSLKIR
jgi:hypothetical protein